MADSLAIIAVLLLIDLSAAYDTVNCRVLLNNLIGDNRVIGILLQNRRFFVTPNGNSRQRFQKKGLTQRNVLFLMLYNIYMNVQPVSDNLQLFIYADDTVVAT